MRRVRVGSSPGKYRIALECKRDGESKWEGEEEKGKAMVEGSVE
jgi:hypothetical protein